MRALRAVAAVSAVALNSGCVSMYWRNIRGGAWPDPPAVAMKAAVVLLFLVLGFAYFRRVER